MRRAEQSSHVRWHDELLQVVQLESFFFSLFRWWGDSVSRFAFDQDRYSIAKKEQMRQFQNKAELCNRRRRGKRLFSFQTPFSVEAGKGLVQVEQESLG